MAIQADKTLQRDIDSLFNLGAIRDLTDGQLLERYVTGQGESAELAFAALVERHGPMVLRACRSKLGGSPDAVDAFQATFLVLIQKARGLWVRDSLGPWLHQVALKTAICARASALRRKRAEQEAGQATAARAHASEIEWDRELEEALHREVDRLPDRYRIPIILCDLQGLTCEQAARRMGCPVGTVKSWRSRGRERLRRRLTRAGLSPTAIPSAFAIGMSLQRGQGAMAEASAAARAVMQSLAAGTVPAAVGDLVQGAIKTMIIGRMRFASVLGMSFLLAGGAAAASRLVSRDPPPPAEETSIEPARQLPATAPPLLAEEQFVTWPLTLAQAIEIGIRNCPEVRMVASPKAGLPNNTPRGNQPTDKGPQPLLIVPRDAGADLNGFRSAVSALVLRIEESYWNLTSFQAAETSATRCVDLAREAVSRGEAEVAMGKANKADLDEAKLRLQGFCLDVVATTSDLITTGRQLKQALGCPATDNRRIIATTPPVEEQRDRDWEVCLAEFRRSRPEASLPPGDILEHESPQRQLARRYLELDARHTEWVGARYTLQESKRRFADRRSDYEQGKITLDRYLDLIARITGEMRAEARHKANYNISISRMEEAKGTLLDHVHVSVDTQQLAALPAPEQATRQRQHDPLPVVESKAANSPVSPPPAQQDRNPQAPPIAAVPPARAAFNTQGLVGPRAVDFDLTIRVGPVPVAIRGSFTVTAASEKSKP